MVYKRPDRGNRVGYKSINKLMCLWFLNGKRLLSFEKQGLVTMYNNFQSATSLIVSGILRLNVTGSHSHMRLNVSNEYKDKFYLCKLNQFSYE